MSRRRGKFQTMFCNPDICPNCQYIGEGDSLCDETGEIVLADWEPTEHFMGPGCQYAKKSVPHLKIRLTREAGLIE